jgi:hypothetical protein
MLENEQSSMDLVIQSQCEPVDIHRVCRILKHLQHMILTNIFQFAD